MTRLPPCRNVDIDDDALRALAAERDAAVAKIEAQERWVAEYTKITRRDFLNKEHAAEHAERALDQARLERKAALARAEAAERRATGWMEAFDRSSRLRAGDASERRHLVAEMTKRGLLPVLQEIDREWLAQSAAHAETHGTEERGGLPADAYGALVAVARAVDKVMNDGDVPTPANVEDAMCALVDVAPGILDQSEPTDAP